MKISRTVRAIAMISAAVMVGCAGDTHESYYEDRHVAPHERVVREEPRYEPRPRVDESYVNADERSAPPSETIVRQDPPPSYDPPSYNQPSYNPPSYDPPRNDPPRYDRGDGSDVPPPTYRDDAPPQQASADYRDDRPVDINVVAEEPDYSTGEDARYFEDDLRPYGDWVVTAEFGRCFRPRAVNVGWRPYSEGHWCNTDDGWLWASDEPHGWATYHYGRWYEDSRYGWCWVPGRTWAPAWVTWRHGGGNVGWAPIPPHRHGSSVSISVEIGHIHPADYVFVEERHLDAPHVHQYARPVQQNVTIINNTTNITNITNVNGRVVNRGVDTAEVERAAGHKVQRVQVVNAADKGPAKQSGTQVAVFKKDIPPKKKPVAASAEHVNDKNANPRTDAPRTAGPERQTLETPKNPAPKNTKPQLDDPRTRDPKTQANADADAAAEAKKRADEAKKRAQDHARNDDVKTDPGKTEVAHPEKTKVEDPQPNPTKPNPTKSDQHPEKKIKADDEPKPDPAPKKHAVTPDDNKTEPPHTEKKTKPADDTPPDTDKNKNDKHAKSDDAPSKSDHPAKADNAPHPEPAHKPVDKAKSDDQPKPKKSDNGDKADKDDKDQPDDASNGKQKDKSNNGK